MDMNDSMFKTRFLDLRFTVLERVPYLLYHKDCVYIFQHNPFLVSILHMVHLFARHKTSLVCYIFRTPYRFHVFHWVTQQNFKLVLL